MTGYLPDYMLRHEIEHGLLTPYDLELIGPASVDLRLADEFLVPFTRDPAGMYLDPLHGRYEYNLIKATKPFDAYGPGVVIGAGQFILASTLEYLRLPTQYIGVVDGKSTLARNGLSIHMAGFIDPGFEGNVTLELFNMGPRPLRLTPGMRICQLRLGIMRAAPAQPYGARGHYQGSQGTVGAVQGTLMPGVELPRRGVR